MARRIGIQPDWVEDLLGIWAAADATGASGRGHDGACPMFRLWGVVDDSRDDAEDSYSSAEVVAMRAAIERLQVERVDHYMAVLAAFKPWTGLEADSRTAELARQAGAMLAEWVDQALGD